MKNKSPIFLLLLLVPPPYVVAQTAGHSGGHSGTFTPITILIIIIAVVFFLTGAVAVFVRHLSDGCLGIHAATAAGGLPAARGLDAETINSIPTYLYSDVKVHRIGKVELECAVCLCEFEDSEELRLLPGCCHVFHPQCIDPWLASHVTCPICRQSLIEPESGRIRPHTVIYIAPISETESNGHDQPTELDDHHDDDDHELSGDDYRDKTEIVGKFTRSHSTGHSLVYAERFTLKLPDGAQNRMVNRSENGGGPLNSMVSPRNEYRRTGWFSMTPPIILPRQGLVCPPITAGLNLINGSKNLALSPVRTFDRLWPI